MFHHLLIPLDGSEYAERALDYGRNLATITSAEVTLLAVTEVSDSVVRMPETARDGRRAWTEHEYLEERAQQLLDDGVVAVGTQVVRGDPVEIIANVALTLRADLIVMSTQGLGADGRYALGSVALNVLKTSHCPVLMVRIDRPHPPQCAAEERWQSEGGANVG